VGDATGPGTPGMLSSAAWYRDPWGVAPLRWWDRWNRTSFTSLGGGMPGVPGSASRAARPASCGRHCRRGPRPDLVPPVLRLGSSSHSRLGVCQRAHVAAIAATGAVHRRARVLDAGLLLRSFFGAGPLVGDVLLLTPSTFVFWLMWRRRPARLPDVPPSGVGWRHGSLAGMSSVRNGPQSSWGVGGLPRPGRIEYRLIRESIVKEYRRGRLGRPEVCDAQPEAAASCEEPRAGDRYRVPHLRTRATCACHVRVRARPSPGGLPLADLRDLGRRAARGSADVACYVVEVCTGCAWNHLLSVSLQEPTTAD